MKDQNHSVNKFPTKAIAFASISISLATVTSFMGFDMPMGGKATLFSMFFISIIGYWFGPFLGITAGVAYGLLQLLLDPYILSIPQVFVDYIFAFGALGVSGFFRNLKHGLTIGYIVSITGRYFFSVLSGVIFFAMYAPEGMNPIVYSLMYNAIYIFAEGVVTLVVMHIPALRNALDNIKTTIIQN